MLTLTGAACVAGDAGKMQWNAAGYFEYCNGVNWIDTKGKLFATCTNQDNKKMRWNSTTSTLQSCDGNNWYNVGPTTVTFTTSQSWVVPTYATAIKISVWGGGGGGGEAQRGGAAPALGASGTAGTLSSVDIPAPISITLLSNPGLGGGGGQSGIPGAGGAGGTASGGDVNTTGGTGIAGEAMGVNIGGDGGAAPSGGKAGSNSGFKGKSGLAPGAGGCGDNSSSTRKAGGGGGAAGLARKTYNDTSLIGLTLTIVVGSAGAQGTSPGAGNGGAGRVIITYW